MSHREKTAWVSLVLMSVLSTVYFWHVIELALGRRDGNTLWLFGVVVLLLVLGEVVLRALLAARSPKEASAPRDERERNIELKAKGIAYPVLLTASFLSIAATHLDSRPWVLAHAVLLALVIAELTRLACQIAYFRRDR